MIIQNIQDHLNVSGEVAINCDNITFPYTILGGDSLICTYSKNVNGADDSLNTVDVTAITYYSNSTNGVVLFGGTATTIVSWEKPNKIDECVTLNNTNPNGPQDIKVCSSDLDENNSYSFDYPVTFSKDQDTDVVWECNQTEYKNTASFITKDTETTGESTTIITGNVQCQNFCAFSQGYWFAKPNVVWPDVNGSSYGQLTIGGFNYTQQEGVAIWKTSNKGGIKDSKKAFLQVAAIKLSSGTSSNLPTSRQIISK